MNIRDKFLADQDLLYTTKLTEKQKLFVSCITAGKNLIDSYKEAYETKSSNKVIGISANALLKNPKIIRAIELKKVELNAAKASSSEKNKLNRHLANELMDLSKTVEDEKIRLKILEMLYDISKKIDS
jgi:phage terminase small subunit